MNTWSIKNDLNMKGKTLLQKYSGDTFFAEDMGDRNARGKKSVGFKKKAQNVQRKIRHLNKMNHLNE